MSESNRLTCPSFPPGSVLSQQPSELLPNKYWSDPVSAEPPQPRWRTLGHGPVPAHTPESSLCSERDSVGPELELERELELDFAAREQERTES